MKYPQNAAALGLLFCSLIGLAKEKKKAPLPEDVLRAHTVLVIVDPTAGVDAQDPNANRLARTDVEQALRQRVGPPSPGQPGTIWIRGFAIGGRMLKVCVRTAEQDFVVTAAWPDQ